MVECSIVVPAYNEEKIIGSTLDRLNEYLSKSSWKNEFEIIVANDGSTDKTLEIVKEKQKKLKTLRISNSTKNIGRGGALTKAFKTARGKYLIYIDADLAVELLLVKKVIQELENSADIVIGSKHLRDSKVDYTLVRRFFSRAYARLARTLLETTIMDYQCGLKGFKRDVIMQILPCIKSTGWSWDTEVIAKAEWQGFKIIELPATIVKVDRGKSKVRVLRDVKRMGQGLLEIMKEKKKFKKGII